MLKQLLTTTALVSVGLVAQADQRNWTGFSVGGETGYVVSRVPNKIEAGNTWEKRTTFGSEGMSLGLKAGGAYQFSDRFLVGLDLDLSFLNTRYSEKIGASNHSFKQNLSYGVSGKLGYVCKNIMAYVRSGVEFGYFRHSASTPANKAQNIKGVDEKVTHTYPGFVMGLGMEYALNDNFILGGEFKHTLYKTKQYEGSAQNKLLTENLEFSPRVSKFLLTAKYKF